MWMGSRQHRNNILNRKAREFGIASQGAEAWVLVMAAPC